MQVNPQGPQNRTLKFDHTSPDKDATGSYLATRGIFAKRPKAIRRKITLFPLARFMRVEGNKAIVNTVSRDLHAHRVEKLSTISNEGITNFLGEMEKKGLKRQNLIKETYKKTRDNTEESSRGTISEFDSKSYAELSKSLSYNFKEVKESIIYTALSDGSLNNDDDEVGTMKDNINSIISDSTLEKIAQDDTALVIKQLILEMSTINQASFMFPYLNQLREKGQISKKAHNSLKEQLVHKIQKDIIPTIKNGGEASEVYFLLTDVESNRYVNASNFNKMRQAYRKQFAVNFRALADSLPNFGVVKKEKSSLNAEEKLATEEVASDFSSESYTSDLENLKFYLDVIKRQKRTISKGRAQKIYDYITTSYVKFTTENIKAGGRSEEDIEKIKEDFVWPIVIRITEEMAKHEAPHIHIKKYEGHFSPLVKKTSDLQEQARISMGSDLSPFVLRSEVSSKSSKDENNNTQNTKYEQYWKPNP